MINLDVLVNTYGMTPEKAQEFLAAQAQREAEQRQADFAKRLRGCKVQVNRVTGTIGITGIRRFRISMHPNEWVMILSPEVLPKLRERIEQSLAGNVPEEHKYTPKDKADY